MPIHWIRVGNIREGNALMRLRLVASHSPGFDDRFGGDWPQFRGPNRDNISTETGL